MLSSMGQQFADMALPCPERGKGDIVNCQAEGFTAADRPRQ